MVETRTVHLTPASPTTRIHMLGIEVQAAIVSAPAGPEQVLLVVIGTPAEPPPEAERYYQRSLN